LLEARERLLGISMFTHAKLVRRARILDSL
jgi:hypothetical protein